MEPKDLLASSPSGYFGMLLVATLVASMLRTITAGRPPPWRTQGRPPRGRQAIIIGVPAGQSLAKEKGETLDPFFLYWVFSEFPVANPCSCMLIEHTCYHACKDLPGFSLGLSWKSRRAEQGHRRITCWIAAEGLEAWHYWVSKICISSFFPCYIALFLP